MWNLNCCLLVILIVIFSVESIPHKKEKAGKQLQDAHMKTTHKPIYGVPPSRKKVNFYKPDQYFGGYKYNYYYGESNEETYAERGEDNEYVDYYRSENQAGNSQKSENIKKDENVKTDKNLKTGEHLKNDKNVKDGAVPVQNQEAVESIETFKEGKETESEGESKYGFVDMSDSEGFYMQNEGGMPFVDKKGFSKGNQILEDPYRFNHGGVFQSNNVVTEPKVIKNCNNEKDAEYYCVKLRDGRYFDPWNPICGYIECKKQKAMRGTCRKGTWMGLSYVIRFSIKDMCRKRLPRGVKVGEEQACPVLTDYNLCKNAESEAENARTT